MNRVLHLSAVGMVNGVTGFVGASVHGEALPTILEHLRHERQVIKLASLIKSTQNFLFTANLNEFANNEI
jgi:hypothetical protein